MKKRRFPRLLAAVLAVAMAVTLLPMTASADTYSTVTVDGLDISVSSEVEGLSLVQVSGNNYNVVSSTGDFPFSFSLILSPYSAVSGTPTVSNGGSFHRYSGDYCLVTPPEGSASVVTIITAANGVEVKLNCPAPSGSGSVGPGVSAYLPAGGQFVNEGVTSGGWGDAFNKNGTLKGLINTTSAMGISLGSFGGYAVFDFGVPAKNGSTVVSGIYNDSGNKYGADFIVYGNAFGGWAEPGCVQVSPDGDKWYDMAGSLHYNSNTMWRYTSTYTNPTPGDDATTYAPGFAGTVATGGVPYTYSYSYKGGSSSAAGSGSGNVDYNAYHAHGWFPLWCNYFTNRNGFGAGGLAQVNSPFFDTSYVTYTGYVPSPLTAATAAFTGVNINNASTQNDDYLFGYCDAHANGTPSATQVNPYTTGRTSGGDPIDISWAVYPAGTIVGGADVSGQPVSLDSIRYVRVYTGVQKMQGILGESSTEVLGVYRATATGVNSGTFATVTVDGVSPTNTPVSPTQRLSTKTVSAGSHIINISNPAAYLLVNGVPVTSPYSSTITTTSGSTTYLQIITQTGTSQPRVTVLKITS
jgi:hypothetical protein